MTAGRAALRTIPEAAEWLGVHESWLRRAVSARAVPHTRLGKHVRFSQAHLDQIVAAGEQQVPTPLRRRRTA